MDGASGTPSQTLIHQGIGASEAAAAVGLDPWTPPIALYERAVGIAPPRVETLAMRMGKLLEPAIRQLYVDETAVEVFVPPKSLFLAEHPWRRATPDGLVPARPLPERLEPGQPLTWARGLEIKTANGFARDQWGEPGTDEVPPQYVCQCAWSMHVLDLDDWDLAVLIDGRDFRVYKLHRDRELEEQLVGAVSAFYHDHIEALVPPPADHTKAFRHYLERRFPDVSDDYALADDAAETLVEIILDRRAQIETLKRDDATDCNRLCQFIGDATGLVTSKGKVHWKPQRGRMLVDWKTIAQRLLEQFHMAGEASDKLIAAHSRSAKASRPLRLPRLKGAAPDAGDED
jgi:putative phage-type endonuclease